MPTRTLVPLNLALVREYAADLIRIYSAAFGVGEDESAWFHEAALVRHCRYDGFQGLLAFEGEQPAGFVYGYRSVSGRWWHDKVRPALEAAGAAFWLDDTFEFVELAVAPEFQGRGYGSDLHDHLLAGAPGRSALLSTIHGRTPARALYDTRGWQVLVPEFRFYPDGDLAVLMGLDLTRPVGRVPDAAHPRSWSSST